MTKKQIIEADVFRSLQSVVDAWESDKTLDEEEMAKHLDGIIDVIDGKNDFHMFLKNSGLNNIQYN